MTMSKKNLLTFFSSYVQKDKNTLLTIFVKLSRSCFDLASSLTIPIDVIRDSDLMHPNEQSLS